LIWRSSKEPFVAAQHGRGILERITDAPAKVASAAPPRAVVVYLTIAAWGANGELRCAKRRAAVFD
jgi:hypothetical protein